MAFTGSFQSILSYNSMILWFSDITLVLFWDIQTPRALFSKGSLPEYPVVTAFSLKTLKGQVDWRITLI